MKTCFLLCSFGFSSFAGLVSFLYLSPSSIFCRLVALGHLFLVADVSGCLVLLAAGLFCGPCCLVGGLLIDGAGAWVVWLGGLLLAWLVVWLCLALLCLLV